MNRYFIELSYRGTGYAGFQVQQNAPTIQSELENALGVVVRQKVTLTGSSRTDSGVHALQNYFHFDTELDIPEAWAYNVNALLPGSIAVRAIRKVKEGSHCRFDARWRRYRYLVYPKKDPFMEGRGYYYPYELDIDAMQEAAAAVMDYHDFSSFAKRNSQVKTFSCVVHESYWEQQGACLVYSVRANRFLRGMVRGLVGTMLTVGRRRISVGEFRRVVESGDSSSVDFSVPGHGLYLEQVGFDEDYFS